VKISDPHRLIPDHSVLHRIVESHPLFSDLLDGIREVRVLPIDQHLNQGPRVEYDQGKREAKLYVASDTARRNDFCYILYHEFSHVADRLNPAFGYSDEVRFSLSDTEQLNVRELWNVYIDARLHHHSLFELGENDRNIYRKINGKPQKIPFSIEGKLIKHSSFLSSRGIREAQRIVQEIWDNPHLLRSYQQLVAIVKVKNG